MFFIFQGVEKFAWIDVHSRLKVPKVGKAGEKPAVRGICFASCEHFVVRNKLQKGSVP